MPQRQLNIRSDEAAALAAALARRLGKTTTEVVVEALRSLELSVEPRDVDGLTADQRREHESFLDFVRSLRPHIVPGSTSEHGELYDENGLPT